MQHTSRNNENPYPVEYDISNCGNEPIHLISWFQPHAYLLVVDTTSWTISHYSSSISRLFAVHSDDNSSFNLAILLGEELLQIIHDHWSSDRLEELSPLAYHLPTNTTSPELYHLLFHRKNDQLLIEIEPTQRQFSSTLFLRRVDNAIHQLQLSGSLEQLLEISVRQIKSLTRFDRVMIYRFDRSHDGEVIAEARNHELPAYLGLRYPASDIPPQVRKLFLSQKVRQIVDVQRPQVPIKAVNPSPEASALDIGFCHSRGVSPIHIQYLKNMEVGASLSIAIVKDKQLWGLIACHHGSSKFIDFRIRTLLQFVGSIIAGHLTLVEAQYFRTSILQANLKKSRLFEQVSQKWDLQDGLIGQDFTIFELVDCDGVALLTHGEWQMIGSTPTPTELNKLQEWLQDQMEMDFFETDNLIQLYPAAAAYLDKAAGLVAIRTTATAAAFICWFRKETIQNISWGGNPEKPLMDTNLDRLNPRNSFAEWKEKRRGYSNPWETYEQEAIRALQADIKEVIIKQYRVVQQKNKDLRDAYSELESFSYSVSHDLRTPLRGIGGFAEILRQDYYRELGPEGQSVIDTIVQSVAKMNDFINGLLSISKVGSHPLALHPLPTTDIIQEEWKQLKAITADDREIELQIEHDLPTIYADLLMFRQVISNLLSNAIKYGKNRKKTIVTVGASTSPAAVTLRIQDNGIGIDSKNLEKIFNVFSRLVRDEEYEGTGVGLAIVKRVVSRHGGKIWAESELDRGATFHVSFPIPTP